MIYLNIQLKLIIFSFIFGFFASMLIEKYNKCVTNKVSRIVVAIIIMICLDIIYFIGIFIIANAIFHIYSLLSIVIGIITYNVILKKIT